jgi:GNAT superfamily N-acetyltransferase
VQRLGEGLQRHLAASPIFLPIMELDDLTHFERWLATPDQVMFLAEVDDQIVASLGVGPANETACSVIEDPGTGSILSAYTLPEVRSLGVAAALLDAAIEYLRDSGKIRCAVDFESQNIQGVRFWMRHFHPVCFSMIRSIDERIAWAGADRPTTSF